MKKFPLIVSMLIIAAMVLAACGADADNNATPGADLTPGVGVVEETPMGSDLVSTPTVEGPAVTDAVPTDAALETPAVVETPTTDDVTTPTAEGSTGSVPVTGDEDCRPNTIQGLLDMDVVDSTGAQIGDVNDVIILRDARAVSSGNGAQVTPSDGAQVTPAAGDGDAQVTPAAGADVVTPNEFQGEMAAPQLAYLVLDLENEDNDVAVPFQAFDLTVKSQGVGGMDDTDDEAETTPVAGETPVVDDAANEAVVCAITLQNVQAEALSGAPDFNDDLDLTVQDWDNEFRTYWSGQGLSIPATGDAAMGAPVVLDDEFNNINAVNNNGDDLGEVEDFILDQSTGTFNYAVLAAGGFLGIGEKYIPVPMNMVQWVSDDPGDLDDAGEIIININEEDWQNVPSFDSVDDLDLTTEGWDTDVRNFWDGLDGSTTD